MDRRLTKTLSFLGALTLGVLAANPAEAQTSGTEKPLRYIYNATWVVPRSMWAEYMKTQASDDEDLRRFVADGTLNDFGSYSVLNHQEGLATHGSWFSASSMGGLMKVLEAERSRPEMTAPSLAASKHWDYILETRDYNGHSGTFKNGYLWIASWSSKAGASDPDGRIVKATLIPALEKLLGDGALHAYSIDQESLHSADPGLLYVAIAANGADGLDKFHAAIEELRKKDPAAIAGFGSLVETRGHRDTLAHVDTMTWK